MNQDKAFSLTKTTQKTITVYEFSNGFYAEVHKEEGLTEFYISHKDYGVKDLAFGILGLNENYEEGILLGNIEKMISSYKEQFFDDAEV